MRTNITMLAALAALAAAGCSSTGAQHPAAAQSSPAKTATTPVATQQPAAATSANTAVANANERRFVTWLTGTLTNLGNISSTVSGPVMLAYIQIENLNAVAAAAYGNPVPAETVTTIPGGYKGCATVNGSKYCDTFTGWLTDASGRITDLNVDGQLLVSAIATCGAATGSQLAITDAVAYRPSAASKIVQLDYKVRNISGHVFGNGSPAWLDILDPTGGAQLREDDTSSILPSSLQPGESAVEALVFDTPTPTGILTLRTNDQHQSVIASCTLRTP
jgi:hypothetical protein